MSELLISPAERSRKAHSLILAALSPSGTQKNLAQIMGTSETKVSLIKTDKLEDSVALIYQLGFKVVPSDRICVDRKKYAALETIARAAMADEANSKKLFWEEE